MSERNDFRPVLPDGDAGDGLAGPPPADELDALLRVWHQENAERAAAGRDRLMHALAAQRRHDHHPLAAPAPEIRRPSAPRADRGHAMIGTIGAIGAIGMVGAALGAALTVPRVRAAAMLAVAAALVALLAPIGTPSARAEGIVMLPEGGRLEALDERGQLIGPCALAHTDVDARISGRFARVTLVQRFTNPYPTKIEAVYTFPMSHRGAVDRMTMTIGDRVVIGEVKERGEARRVYESARASGYVASLLEQERPNIFTQSVANIEPGANVIVEISYVEPVEIENGAHRFIFPMVVAPRYIPGVPAVSRALVPAELVLRRGVILRGPAQLVPGRAAGGAEAAEGGAARDALQGGKLEAILAAAQPIEYPGAPWWGEGPDAQLPALWQAFEAQYCDGSKEIGWLHVDGTGQINGRWFFTDPALAKDLGTGFAADTDQVPDASRITPMPARPGTRAGHDLSLRVTIETGGPRIVSYRSELHEVEEARGAGGAAAAALTLDLARQREIPNRDFILEWRVAEDAIEEAHLVHRGAPGRYGDFDGGFFALMLNPPARVANDAVRRRELIFVMDCSGSMEGFPVEKAKAVMLRAIDSMRAGDVFNVITFNDSFDVLWDEPQPASATNRAAARAYVDARQGGGGTEMRPAVLAALRGAPAKEDGALAPIDLANLPADGRAVRVRAALSAIAAPGQAWRLRVRDDLMIDLDLRAELPAVLTAEGVDVVLDGAWTTQEGERVLVVERLSPVAKEASPRMRCVFFLSDGEVGNDDEVVAAIRAHARETRVFTVAIGNSPNRSLLDAMAQAGRGAADYVTLEGDPDAVVERFVARTGTPVLTDIELAFEGASVLDVIPAANEVPDLYDERPLVILGRYLEPGHGRVVITGNTGNGPFRREVALDLPERSDGNDVVATLWARARVDELAKREDRAGIVELGETFSLLTAHTSFVAVERSRVTLDGQPMLVAIPIEMPQGQSWAGTFGGGDARGPVANVTKAEVQILLGLMLANDVTESAETAADVTQGLDVLDKIDQAGATTFGVPLGAPLPDHDRTAALRALTTGDAKPVPDADVAAAVQDWAGRSFALVHDSLGAYGADAQDAIARYAEAGSAYLFQRAPVAPDADGGQISFPWLRGGADGGAPDARGVTPDGIRDWRKQTVMPEQSERMRALLAYPVEPTAAPEEARNEHERVLELARQLNLPRYDNAPSLDLDSALAEGGYINRRVPNLGDIPMLGEIFRARERESDQGGANDRSPPPAFPAERAVVVIVAVALSGDLEQARALADRLADGRPDFDLALELREAMKDESLAADARRERFEAIAAKAHDRIETLVAQRALLARLRAVLDERLWPPAFAAPDPSSSPARVTILLEAADARAVAALEQAGLVVEGRSRGVPLVVGRIAPDRLARAALVEGVRRIEPTQATAAR
jgi:hypothetical protein